MEHLKIAEQSGITVVTLEDGKANTLGSGMVRALTETAGKLADGRGPVVLTGAGRFFSAGLDLVEVVGMDRHTLGAFLDSFEQMALQWFALPRPVIAAVNGHAIAGGAIMALTADFRIAARGEWKIGLTEVSLGIPFPASALEMTRFQVDPSRASRFFLAGELYAPDEATAAGVLDRVVAPEALAEEAGKLAARLATSPGVAYAQTKAALRQPTLARIESARAERREAFLDALLNPVVRGHIEGTLNAMKSKKR